MSLTVTITEKKPEIFIVSPVGSIDSITYTILEKEVESVLDLSPKAIIFDMKGVTYMSSMGVRVILKTKKTLKRNEGKLIVVNPQPQIKKVFDVINAFPPQQVFASVEELDSYLDEIQGEDIEERKSL